MKTEYLNFKAKASKFSKKTILDLAEYHKVEIDYIEITLRFDEYRHSVEYWHVQGHGQPDNVHSFMTELYNLSKPTGANN